MSFFAELKRRNVIRVAVAYAVASWLLIQVLEIATDAFEAPPWVLKIVMTLLAIGLVPALIFSWVYELTPDGLKKEEEVSQAESVTAHTAKRLNLAVIALLVVAIGLFAADRMLFSKGQPAEGAQTASQVTGTEQSLPGPGAPNGAGSVPVVAVLPFAARSAGDDDGRFLADGLHDDLLTQLAKLDVFQVVSRTSVMEYLGTTKNMRQIGEELGAGAILEGGLQQAGGRVRINVQLIETATDKHLWAETFDRELSPENIFTIQADIARAIAKALHATLSDAEAAGIAQAPTNNQAAYEAFLQGRLNANALDNDLRKQAVRQLENAVRLDPQYVQAWGWLGMSRLLLAWDSGQLTPEDQPMIDAALEAIDKARSIDPTAPETVYAEAHYHYWIKADYPRAIAMINPVIEAAPNNGDFIAARGWFNRRAGNWDQAIADLERARTLDPRNPQVAFELGAFYTQVRQWDRAEAALERALQTTGDRDGYLTFMSTVRLECCGDLSFAREFAEQRIRNGQGSLVKAQLYLLEGRTAEAITLLNAPDPEDPEQGPSFRLSSLVVAHAMTGQMQHMTREAKSYQERLLAYQARYPQHAETYDHLALIDLALGDVAAATRSFAHADKLRRKDALQEAQIIASRASTYAIFGQHDRALDLLEQSLQTPGGTSWPVIRIDAAYEGLRDNPKYQALEKRFAVSGETL